MDSGRVDGMSAELQDIGETRVDEGVSLRHAALTVVVFFLVAAVLNGSALHEKASRRAYGNVRDAWMTATAPLDWLARNTGAGRLRAFADDLIDHGL